MVWFYLAILSEQFVLDVVVFQSHYGLILSFEDISKKTKHKIAFNPTMVWFYPWEQVGDWQRNNQDSFQSHYGLILSVLKI